MKPDMINSKPSHDRPVVLFDGDCPLCSREIAHYRRRKNSNEFEWVDASKDTDKLRSLSISQQDAMSVFHVRGVDGKWQTGVSGFLYIWSRLPAYRWLARIINTSGMKPLLERGYRLFLKYRPSLKSSST